MNIHKVLKAMQNDLFGGSFAKFIQCEIHEGDKAISYGTEYDKALAALPQVFSETQKKEFAALEKKYAEQEMYVAKYSFICGIYAGFGQYFRTEDDFDGTLERFSYDRLVTDQLLKRPDPRWPLILYQSKKRSSALYDHLRKDLNHHNRYHLCSVATYWQERASLVAYNGFYCGYREALEWIGMMDHEPSGRLVGLTLMTEYDLGITFPKSSRESVGIDTDAE